MTLLRCRHTHKDRRCLRPFWHVFFGVKRHFYGKREKTQKA